MRTRESVSDEMLPMVKKEWETRTSFQRSEVGARSYHTYITRGGEVWGDIDAALAVNRQLERSMSERDYMIFERSDWVTRNEFVAKQINAWLDSGFLKKLEGEPTPLY